MYSRFCCAVILFTRGPCYGMLRIDDVHRLNPTVIRELCVPTTTAELCALVKQAASRKLAVSVAGGKHSQGGQAFVRDGVVIDITKLTTVIALDAKNKTVTVEPGITWKALQEYINPHGLALKVMQHYNNFTVGGSLAVNAHGLDAAGSIIHVVKNIKVLVADGTVVTASRAENYDLFRRVIGGYGLYGIILEATLQLTDNVFLDVDVQEMRVEDYENYYMYTVKNDPALELHYAEISAPTKFNKTGSLVSVTYRKSAQQEGDIRTQELPSRYEPHDDFTFDLLKSSDLLKQLAFFCRKQDIKKCSRVTRNAVMRTSAHIVCSQKSVNILQEYFIPAGHLATFVARVEQIVRKNRVNLLGTIIRFVPRDLESALPYARQDSFSAAIFINHPKSSRGFRKAQRVTRDIINAALDCGGSFYLVAQPYATSEQFKKVYSLDNYSVAKKCYDPCGLFDNTLGIYLSNGAL